MTNHIRCRAKTDKTQEIWHFQFVTQLATKEQRSLDMMEKETYLDVTPRKYF